MASTPRDTRSIAVAPTVSLGTRHRAQSSPATAGDSVPPSSSPAGTGSGSRGRVTTAAVANRTSHTNATAPATMARTAQTSIGARASRAAETASALVGLVPVVEEDRHGTDEDGRADGGTEAVDVEVGEPRRHVEQRDVDHDREQAERDDHDRQRKQPQDAAERRVDESEHERDSEEREGRPVDVDAGHHEHDQRERDGESGPSLEESSDHAGVPASPPPVTSSPGGAIRANTPSYAATTTISSNSPSHDRSSNHNARSPTTTPPTRNRS